MPDCLTDIGCRIGEDIALDREVNMVLENFLLAKRSPSARQSPKIYEQLLGEAGLLDDLHTLFAMEAIYHAHESEQHRAREELTKLGNA